MTDILKKEGNKTQHILNNGHIFCRLMDLGFSVKTSKRIAGIFKWALHRFLYRR